MKTWTKEETTRLARRLTMTLILLSIIAPTLSWIRDTDLPRGTNGQLRNEVLKVVAGCTQRHNGSLRSLFREVIR
jgi:hypothetical protein